MTTTYVKHTFRQNAMDLNPDLVAKVDEQIAFELDTMDDLDIARHWIFHDKMYHRAMVNLIIAVRRVQIALKVPATLTDMQIAGKLIRSAGLWELPRPKTIWERTRFLSRFLVTYASTNVKAHQAINHGKHQMRQQHA